MQTCRNGSVPVGNHGLLQGLKRKTIDRAITAYKNHRENKNRTLKKSNVNGHDIQQVYVEDEYLLIMLGEILFRVPT